MLRYKLRTLLILLAIWSPVLAGLWYLGNSITSLIGWTAFVGFFVFWYWRLHHAQSLNPRTRGEPSYDTETGASGGE
jgi:hypothetical protein